MKKLLFLHLLLSCILCVCCSKDEKEPAFIEVTSPTSLVYENLGGQDTIFVNSNQKWEILGATDWCSIVAISNTTPQYVIVEILPTNEKNDRSTTLTFVCGDQSVPVYITQYGSREMEYVDLKLESPDAVEYNKNSGLLTVSYKNSIPTTVRKGHVIVLPLKYDYDIRVIESVKINDQTLTIQTSQGYMNNLFKNMEFTLSTDLTLGGENVIYPAEVGYLSSEGNYHELYNSKTAERDIPEFFSYQKSFDQDDLYNQNGNRCYWEKCGLKAKLNGAFYFKFGEKEENNSKKGELEKFSMHIYGDFTNDYLLKYDFKQAVNENIDKMVQENFAQSYVFRFIVNTVPVVIVTHAHLNKMVELQGSSSLSVTTGFKNNGSIDLKTEWSKGGEITNANTYNSALEIVPVKRQVAGTFSGKVSYYPHFEFELYRHTSLWLKPSISLSEDVTSVSKNYDNTFYAWKAETKSEVDLSIGGNFNFVNDDKNDWTLPSQSLKEEIVLQSPSKIELISPEDSIHITRNKNVEAKFLVTSYCPSTDTYEPCAGALVYFEAENGLNSQAVVSDDNGMAIVSWKPTTLETNATLKAGIVGEGNTYIDESLLNVFFKETSTLGQAVDLGLSVEWSSFNLGANAPEEFGDCFAWAEIEEKSAYTQDSYIYANDEDNDGDLLNHEYENIGDNIEGSERDVAHVTWGEGWRLPTNEEVEELIDKCTWEWTSQNGINGRKVTGPNGNSIFFPATGQRDESGLRYQNVQGFYWTGSINTANHVWSKAFRLYFCQSFVRCQDELRFLGGFIRPVRSK